MKKKLSLLALVLVAVVSLIAACAAPAPTPAPAPSPAAPAEVIKWSAQCQTTAGDTQNIAQHRVANIINSMANGSLVMDLQDGGAIISAGKEIDGLIDGSIDCAFTPYAFTQTIFPVAEVFADVVGGLSPSQLMLWYTEGVGEGHDLATEYFGQQDVKLVHTACILTSEIWCHSKVEIKSVADIKGLKMRCAGAGGEILAKMGAATTFVPGAEIYESMQRGVIDAFEYDSATPNWNMGFQEVADYVYVGATRAPSAVSAVFVMQDTWAELPDNLKTILVEACRANLPHYLATLVDSDGEHLKMFKDYGCTVAPIPEDVNEELVRVAKDYFQEKSAGDPWYAKVYESLMNWKDVCVEQGIY